MRTRYDAQIESQPDAVEAVVRAPPPGRLDLSRPILLAGLGTSLHAARVAAAWISDLGGHADAVEAHEFALRGRAPAGSWVVAISHRGRGFTAGVLARAKASGARTCAVVGIDAGAPDAELVVRTCRNETAGTHSVSYLTALAALGRLAGLDLSEAPGLLRQALAVSAPVEQARVLVGKDPCLIAGFGIDAVAAAEAALKLKEAAFVWAEGTSVELALHGPVVALRPGMGAVTFTPAVEDAGRTQRLREALSAIGVTALTCGAANEDLSFPACSEVLRPIVSAVPLQRLAAELARLTGGDPDGTRSGVEPWKTALERSR
jgi:glutamine---fructose-6-phosphate transaminase (isomerizing)